MHANVTCRVMSEFSLESKQVNLQALTTATSVKEKEIEYLITLGYETYVDKYSHS